MKTVRIYCLHPLCGNVDEMLNYMRLTLPDFNFEWSPSSPDYLIATEHIYTNRVVNREFKRLWQSAKIVVLYVGEALSPDFNLFDYAVGFDANLNNGDRFVQLPPPYIMFKGFVPRNTNDITSVEEARTLLSQKSGFCNFLYSNWMAHPNRDRLFYILSKYKKVDSLGRHLNNVGVKGTGWIGHAKDCVTLKSPYKFSIACENASFAGYTSEKLLTSLSAHTVPIYWGDPEIVRNVNPDCFINCNEFESLDEVTEIVKRVDEDDELWARMVAAPWCKESQIVYHERRYEDYVAFFRNIFSQDIDDAKRKPEGTFPNWAHEFFFRNKLRHHGRVFFVLKKAQMQIRSRKDRRNI